MNSGVVEQCGDVEFVNAGGSVFVFTINFVYVVAGNHSGVGERSSLFLFVDFALRSVASRFRNK